MNRISFKDDRFSEGLQRTWLRILVVFLLLCPLALMHNMTVNEQDLLPLAKQYADSTWIPGDWYLNQPPSYRMLFQALFGQLISLCGFLATSIIGRLLCYLLVASGLVLIGQQLGLRLTSLLLAVTLFLYLKDFRFIVTQFIPLEAAYFNYISYVLIALAIGLVLTHKRLHLNLSLPLLLLAFGIFLRGGKIFQGGGWSQGVAAGEWLIGGLEAKSVSYGLVLIAVGLMLGRNYRWMALLLGLATSFHVLVGGYTFLAVVIWLYTGHRLRSSDVKEACILLLTYLVSSAFAIKPIVEQFLVSTPVEHLLPSYIYVFWRLPHHLNPLTWSRSRWASLAIYLLVLILSTYVIKFYQSNQALGKQSFEQDSNRIALFEFTLICLIFFVVGVVIAPFDSQGKFLQYYPFRLADVMLPLNAWLLFICAMEQTFNTSSRRVFSLVVATLVGLNLSIQIASFEGQLLTLNQFPKVDPQLKDVCAWVRKYTPRSATVISSPVEDEDFSWLSERSTIVKFKFLPQTKAGVLSWYERLLDLSGNSYTFPTNFERGFSVFEDIGEPLAQHYKNLTASQIKELAAKYNADYFLTRSEHHVELSIAYQNQSYTLYKK